MKFIITESKIVSAMEKYLDNQDFIRINTYDRVYFANSEDDEIAQIMYDYGTGICYIDSDLIVEIDDFFSSKYIVTRNVIAGWVENKLNTKVVETNSWLGIGATLLRIPDNWV